MVGELERRIRVIQEEEYGYHQIDVYILHVIQEMWSEFPISELDDLIQRLKQVTPLEKYMIDLLEKELKVVKYWSGR